MCEGEVTLFQESGHGEQGRYGIKIQIYSNRVNISDEDYETKKFLNSAGRRAAEDIKAELMKILIKKDPKTKDTTDRNKKLLDVFDCPVYVEEIKNGYCNGWCCEHIPWFKITTSAGHFIIGWRKQVIELDWSLTDVKKDAEELFPYENVTKVGMLIHAHSIEDAKKYVMVLMEAADKDD